MNDFLGMALGRSFTRMLDISPDRSICWPIQIPADLLGLNSKAAVFRKARRTSETTCCPRFWVFPEDPDSCCSIFSESPTFPHFCCEAEEANTTWTSSQRAGSAALWHEGLVGKSQTCPVPGVCRADPLRRTHSVHGCDWDLLSRVGLCSVSLWRLHCFLPGWSSLGIRSSREQPSQTWLDKPGQQRGSLPVSLGDHADERQHYSCSHHGYHGTWNLAALWSVPAAHLPQLVQSPARHHDHCGIFFSCWNSHN